MKIEQISQLRKLYGFPGERAQNKILSTLDKHAINYIKKSPFLAISTIDEDGNMDVSPRGGMPGFVKVLNEKEIVIPDSKGNNRLDSLSNIVNVGRVGTLFLIPGVDETLRINGGAYLSTDTELLNLFLEEKNPPKACIVIQIEEIFLHCAKAFMRSKLWMEEAKIERSEFPSMGQMLNDQLGTKGEPESREAMIKRYQDDL